MSSRGFKMANTCPSYRISHSDHGCKHSNFVAGFCFLCFHGASLYQLGLTRLLLLVIRGIHKVLFSCWKKATESHRRFKRPSNSPSNFCQMPLLLRQIGRHTCPWLTLSIPSLSYQCHHEPPLTSAAAQTQVPYPTPLISLP